MKRPLNKEERRAVAALKKVAEIWPDTLWLFSASGTLCVMQTQNGERKVCSEEDYEGIDRNCLVDHIDIPNDGGDW